MASCNQKFSGFGNYFWPSWVYGCRQSQLDSFGCIKSHQLACLAEADYVNIPLFTCFSGRGYEAAVVVQASHILRQHSKRSVPPKPLTSIEAAMSHAPGAHP